MELKLGVHDSTSVANAKIMTWVKQLGVARGSIVQLWFEKAILPVAEPADENTITETITKPINAARRMVNEQAAASNVSTGDLSEKMTESQQQALEQVDASAAIEVALCECSGQAGRGAGIGQEPHEGSGSMLHIMGWQHLFEKAQGSDLATFLDSPH